MCFRGQPVLLLINEQSDLGDAFQTVQCAASVTTCSFRVMCKYADQ